QPQTLVLFGTKLGSRPVLPNEVVPVLSRDILWGLDQISGDLRLCVNTQGRSTLDQYALCRAFRVARVARAFSPVRHEASVSRCVVSSILERRYRNFGGGYRNFDGATSEHTGGFSVYSICHNIHYAYLSVAFLLPLLNSDSR